MEKHKSEPRLRTLQQAGMRDRIVLLRVDHNVVKRGRLNDSYRINATLGTLYAIAQRGGKPILMTHVGRPRDKKTGNIKPNPEQTIELVVKYIEQILPIKIEVPDFPIDPDRGILTLDASIMPCIKKLQKGDTDMVYLPNIRWFQGEQAEGPERDIFARELASIADLYINDAFGSWQPNVSTYHITKQLPSYAGILMQKEIKNLAKALDPERPFISVIAGSKYDTKIGPLTALHGKVDHLILGGLMYNTFISAKYGIKILGVSEEDIKLAKHLVKLDEKEKKIIEMPYIIESDTTDGKFEGRHRSIKLSNLQRGDELKYVLDIDPRSFQDPEIVALFNSARTIFVNAVMGLMPGFCEGSRALYELVSSNMNATKLFGGGDTLQEFKNLSPGIYLKCLEDSKTYYFTGGGSVLSAVEKGSPYLLDTVRALLEKQ